MSELGYIMIGVFVFCLFIFIAAAKGWRCIAWIGEPLMKVTVNDVKEYEKAIEEACNKLLREVEHDSKEKRN